LRARLTNAISTLSAPIDILGAPPTLSALGDITVDEDTPVLVAITINDAETSPDFLQLTATSSNLALLPGVTLSGSGTDRLLSLTPATNASGSVQIAVALSDGAHTVVSNFFLHVRPVNDTPFLVPPITLFQENFDTAALAGIPFGWVSRVTAGSAWRVINTQSASPPHALFAGSTGSNADTAIETPVIQLNLPAPQLVFRHRFLAAECCERGSLDIGVGTGPFTPLPSVGATYLTGAPGPSGAWTGDSGGFITTTVNLPASLIGQNVRFRWRYVSTTFTPQLGWWIDNIALRDASRVNPFEPIQFLEDTPSPSVALVVADPETPNLAVTVTSTNAALLSSLTVSGSGSNRTLNIRPFADAYGSDLITLRVSDGEATATYNVPLTILPVNDPPFITSALSNSFVHLGEQIGFFIRAHHPDPAETLTFTLQSGHPAARLDPNFGFFTWTVPIGPSVQFVVTVTDNGSPPLSDSRTFRLMPTPFIVLRNFTNDLAGFHMSWNTIPDRAYRVHYTDDLGSPWLDLPGDFVATGGLLNATLSSTSAQRFYRITVLPLSP
jgi:hypothetical protein